MNIRRVVVVVVGLLVAAIAVAGLWVLLAPAPDLVVSHSGAMGFATEAGPAKLLDGVATFALLAMGLGVVIGLAAWFGLRSSRGLGGLAFVTLMSIATSGLALDLADRFGRMAHGAIDRGVPGTYVGTVNLWLEGDVGPSWILLICAPTAGLLAYLVCVLSSGHADLGVGDADFTPIGPGGPGGPRGPDGPGGPGDLTSAAEAPQTHP